MPHTKSQNYWVSLAFQNLVNKINRSDCPFPDGQKYKCLNFEAAKIRARPSAVFAPVLTPPRSRHRPFVFWVSFFFWAFEAGITGRKHPPFYVNWTALFEREVFFDLCYSRNHPVPSLQGWLDDHQEQLPVSTIMRRDHLGNPVDDGLVG